jgi:hypothetical protein
MKSNSNHPHHCFLSKISTTTHHITYHIWKKQSINNTLLRLPTGHTIPPEQVNERESYYKRRQSIGYCTSGTKTPTARNCIPTATMSHFAVRRFTANGLTYSRFLSVSLVKPYSPRCNRIDSPLKSYSPNYRRAFMNSADDGSKSNDSVKSPDEILNECSRLYDSLSGVNEKLGGMAVPKSSPHTR